MTKAATTSGIYFSMDFKKISEEKEEVKDASRTFLESEKQDEDVDPSVEDGLRSVRSRHQPKPNKSQMTLGFGQLFESAKSSLRKNDFKKNINPMIESIKQSFQSIMGATSNGVLSNNDNGPAEELKSQTNFDDLDEVLTDTELRINK